MDGRFLRDDVSLEAQSQRLQHDLGDVLWYVAVLAAALRLNLSEVADSNLARTSDRYEPSEESFDYATLEFDEGFPQEERFPRRAVFRMKEVERDGLPHSEFSIVSADPNMFPSGPVPHEGGTKKQGFQLNTPIGDVVNDNAGSDDGYRYHDAVHIGFMAVLGWSPVMRQLLHLKRKCRPDVDRVQDGARARDLEEALSAVLKEMSIDRNNFSTVADIDGDVRDQIRRIVAKLEVSAVPIWLWVKAIHQGFEVSSKLHAEKGGYVIADLDARTVSFSREAPEAG